MIEMLGPNARTYFNNNPEALRTFDEAVQFLISVNLRRGRVDNRYRRNNLYAVSQVGFLEWRLNPADNGIINYDENSALRNYGCTLQEFIEQKRTLEDTIGFLPVDLSSLGVLERSGYFDPRYLLHWIGIDKKFTA